MLLIIPELLLLGNFMKRPHLDYGESFSYIICSVKEPINVNLIRFSLPVFWQIANIEKPWRFAPSNEVGKDGFKGREIIAKWETHSGAIFFSVYSEFWIFYVIVLPKWWWNLWIFENITFVSGIWIYATLSLYVLVH